MRSPFISFDSPPSPIWRPRGVGNTISITERPTITGTPEVGATLTGSDGTATGAGTTAVTARQWYRDGVPISGATSGTYTATESDVERSIAFGVTWSDDNGVRVAISDPVTVAAVDNTLTWDGDPLTWNGDPLIFNAA